MAAAAVGGALAGCHPTGTRYVDPVETALFAAVVTAACSLASRRVLLVFGALCVILGRGWIDLPGLAALLVAFASVFVTSPIAMARLRLPVGAIVGACGIQSILRWPAFGFHGATAVAAAVAVAFPLVSAYIAVSRRRRRRYRRVLLGGVGVCAVAAVPLVVAGAWASTRVRSGVDKAQAALGEVGQGVSVAAPLRSAATEFHQASSALGGWWVQASRLVPVVAQQGRALAVTTKAAGTLGSESASVASRFVYSRLDYRDGRIDLRSVAAMQVPAQSLDRALVATDRTLAGLSSTWLVGPVASEVHRFAADVDRAQVSADLATMATRDLPTMLGGTEPQHYFVAFMAPSESRGLGGILGAYAELTAADGKVILTRSGHVGDLNDALPPGGGTLTGPPDFLEQYGQFAPGDAFQDVTFSPDLPTVGQVLAQLYPEAGGDPVNGVLVLDPVGLARLLSITGPVTVPGLPYELTSTNAVPFLLRGLYQLDGGSAAAQDQLQGQLIKVAFQKLVDGSLPSPEALSQLLEPAVLGGHIGYWGARQSDAALVGALHLADAFPSAGHGDLMSVTTQNAGANKLDAYLRESIKDRILVDPATGSVQAQVTVTLRDDAPPSGLPPLVADSPLAPGTPTGADPLLVSVYSPYGVDGVGVDGAPASVSSSEELGVHVYRQWVTVPAGGSTTLELNLLGAHAPGSRYTLSLHLPPAANPVSFEASLSGAGRTSTWVAGPESDQVHHFAWP